jgi:hypothetical protein
VDKRTFKTAQISLHRKNRNILTMTAEELFGEHFNGLHYDDITSMCIENYAKDFARLKCQELLEIVAEKASKMEATIYINPTAPRYARLNKESILNAVDLNSFIS